MGSGKELNPNILFLKEDKTELNPKQYHQTAFNQIKNAKTGKFEPFTDWSWIEREQNKWNIKMDSSNMMSEDDMDIMSDENGNDTLDSWMDHEKEKVKTSRSRKNT